MTGPGGRRDGAGRKPDRGVRKRNLTIKITPELRAFLDSLEPSCANTVEDTIRRTTQFRAWLRARRTGSG